MPPGEDSDQTGRMRRLAYQTTRWVHISEGVFSNVAAHICTFLFLFFCFLFLNIPNNMKKKYLRLNSLTLAHRTQLFLAQHFVYSVIIWICNVFAACNKKGQQRR